jgi:hypothetical protein
MCEEPSSSRHWLLGSPYLSRTDHSSVCVCLTSIITIIIIIIIIITMMNILHEEVTSGAFFSRTFFSRTFYLPMRKSAWLRFSIALEHFPLNLWHFPRDKCESNKNKLTSKLPVPNPCNAVSLFSVFSLISITWVRSATALNS